ncbi:hypothetical protein FQR65_LT04601 [Abscondita terminalis]|nr:hypothetical protein FQR65_LT04601 [Abscondita terminalis]
MGAKLFLLFVLMEFLTKISVASELSTCKVSKISTILKEDIQRLFENEIKQIVECIRKFIQNGIGGIKLDPFQFPIFPLYLDTDQVSSSMWLTSIHLDGLSGFTLDVGTVDIEIFPPRAVADIALSFSEIKMSTNYDGKMKLMNLIKLFGKGSVSINLDGLKIRVHAVVNFIPTAIQEVKIEMELLSVKVDISGLFNDQYMSKLISRQMTDTFTQLAQEHQNKFNSIINTLIRPLLITYPIDSSFDEFIQMIKDDIFNCDSSVQKGFEFLNKSINNFVKF